MPVVRNEYYGLGKLALLESVRNVVPDGHKAKPWFLELATTFAWPISVAEFKGILPIFYEVAMLAGTVIRTTEFQKVAAELTAGLATSETQFGNTRKKLAGTYNPR